MGSRQVSHWQWTEEQPGVIVIVVLILAFALLFPQDACRGRALYERSTAPAPVRWAAPAEPEAVDGEPL